MICVKVGVRCCGWEWLFYFILLHDNIANSQQYDYRRRKYLEVGCDDLKIEVLWDEDAALRDRNAEALTQVT